MRDPSPLSSRPAASRRTTYTIDVVVLSSRGKSLGILCQAAIPRKKARVLPYGDRRRGESLETCARRVVRELVGHNPGWMEQIGAFTEGRHESGAEVSIGFVAVLPGTSAAPIRGGDWATPGELNLLAPRQRSVTSAALVAVRTRMDHAPIAFHLLPVQFTLTELQQTYELLLGRRLHKASFRRALQAAYLVEPTDEWRSEGRGRPAQFFSFAPRKRRGGRRGVRFDSIV